MMNGPKVMFMESLVDSCKTTIILLVSTMDLATALHRHAPGSITWAVLTLLAIATLADTGIERVSRHRSKATSCLQKMLPRLAQTRGESPEEGFFFGVCYRVHDFARG